MLDMSALIAPAEPAAATAAAVAETQAPHTAPDPTLAHGAAALIDGRAGGSQAHLPATAHRGAGRSEGDDEATGSEARAQRSDAASGTATQAPSDALQAEASRPATAAPVVAMSAKPVTAATVQIPSQPLPEAPSGAGAIGSTVLALLLIVGLILALAWLARRMPGAIASSNRSLRVVASLAVGQRERVVVVDVGGTQLLLGVGPGGTRTLHTLAEPLPVADAPAPFAQLLAQQFGKKRP